MVARGPGAPLKDVAGGGPWRGWRWPTGAEGLPVWTDLRLGSCCLGPHL